MGINWLLALKAVPWTDVAQAAPGIVKGARKLFTTVRGASAAAGARETKGEPLEVEARLHELASRLDTLASEQQASAEVLRNLAEQNARLIEAIGIMRARARLLAGLCLVSTVAVVAMVVWMLAR